MGQEQAEFYAKIRALVLEESAEANPLASTPREKQVGHAGEKAGTQQPEKSDHVMPAEGDRSSVFEPTLQEIDEEVEQLYKQYPLSVREDLKQLYKQVYYSRVQKHLSVTEDKELAKQSQSSRESAELVEESTATKKFDLKAPPEAQIDDPPKLPDGYEPKPSPLLKTAGRGVVFQAAAVELDQENTQLVQENKELAGFVERRRQQIRDSAKRARERDPEGVREKDRVKKARQRERKKIEGVVQQTQQTKSSHS